MLDRSSSFASGTNTKFLESLYEEYMRDSNNLDSSWQCFFQGYEMALGSRHSLKDAPWSGEDRRESAHVEAMINAFRRLGYLSANLDPIADPPEIPTNMSPQAHGLKDIDPERKFLPSNFGQGEMSFATIWKKLLATYCGTIGPDYRDINNVEAITWLQERMEACDNSPQLETHVKKHILVKLSQAEGFEKFLHTRYLGQKRFSIEGLEVLVPLLDIIAAEAARSGVEEVCMGMAHRGRLNVLANVMQKPYRKMLLEFEGTEFNPFDIDGDVKYHLGYANEIETVFGDRIRMFLSPNPSHLEAVNPLVEGFCYARQERFGGAGKIMPILLHGDAAFIGQGIVSEVLNLSQLRNYGTGGTIHIITNNKIGFTSSPEESCSCSFNSDISKMVRAPVLHVNADDPEAVVWVGKLATAYRKRFSSDIVIDLIGYRRHGHNETDEPAFTQPLLYKKIARHPGVLSLYVDQLHAAKTLSVEETSSYAKSVRTRLDEAQKAIRAKGYHSHPMQVPEKFQEIFAYRKPSRQDIIASVRTAVSDESLAEVAGKLTQLPDNFVAHPKINRLLQNRRKQIDKIDWGFAELLAFGTLAKEGVRVRLSGQDCKRGTFSSRHGVLVDYETGQEHSIFAKEGWAPVDIINSPLTEQGCLGFEFGYSTACNSTLVLWEAQFGDFANGAQIIIDQFIVASEAKWQQTSSLVLLLPHGYEGMGPEHSSARPERFLQACGNLNIQVCNFTTPAQYFHALRRQMLRSFRKPLIVMTPKSLLRHPELISSRSDFIDSQFEEVLDDAKVSDPASAERILMCTGKIYFDLEARRRASSELANMPIVRIEQLYPFPYEKLDQVFRRYPRVKEVVWVQEEPANMGAWTFVNFRIPRIASLNKEASVIYVGRKGSGSTAEGSAKAHQVEQKRIIDEAFSLVCAWEPKVVR